MSKPYMKDLYRIGSLHSYIELEMPDGVTWLVNDARKLNFNNQFWICLN